MCVCVCVCVCVRMYTYKMIYFDMIYTFIGQLLS